MTVTSCVIGLAIRGSWGEELKLEEKGRMIRSKADTIWKEGDAMVREGLKMMKNNFMVEKGELLIKDGVLLMKEGVALREMSDMMIKEGQMMLTKGDDKPTDTISISENCHDDILIGHLFKTIRTLPGLGILAV